MEQKKVGNDGLQDLFSSRITFAFAGYLTTLSLSSRAIVSGVESERFRWGSRVDATEVTGYSGERMLRKSEGYRLRWQRQSSSTCARNPATAVRSVRGRRPRVFKYLVK